MFHGGLTANKFKILSCLSFKHLHSKTLTELKTDFRVISQHKNIGNTAEQMETKQQR